MSSVPGGSGENIVYSVLCGGALVGALSYVSLLTAGSGWGSWDLTFFDWTFYIVPQAYSTVNSDHNRFNSRLEDIRSRPKAEWVAKPWPPKSKCFFFFFNNWVVFPVGQSLTCVCLFAGKDEDEGESSSRAALHHCLTWEYHWNWLNDESDTRLVFITKTQKLKRGFDEEGCSSSSGFFCPTSHVPVHKFPLWSFIHVPSFTSFHSHFFNRDPKSVWLDLLMFRLKVLHECSCPVLFLFHSCSLIWSFYLPCGPSSVIPHLFFLLLCSFILVPWSSGLLTNVPFPLFLHLCFFIIIPFIHPFYICLPSPLFSHLDFHQHHISVFLCLLLHPPPFRLVLCCCSCSYISLPGSYIYNFAPSILSKY